MSAVERSPEAVSSLTLAAQAGERPARRGSVALRAFLRHRLALSGAVVVGVIVLIALLAPLVATRSPNAIDLFAVNQGPTRAHILGTDQVGRDVFSRLVFGARVSLSVGIFSVMIYTAIGTVLGAVSGYYGGLVDGAVQRFTDTVMCFPSLVIIMAAVAIVGPSVYNIIILIGVLTWPGICRIVRGEFLSLREKEFVEAAHAVGASDGRIIFRHILPNAVAPVVVAATFGVAAAILTEAGLSFLGLGVQPPTPSWGNMVNTAQSATVLKEMPWLWIPAGVMIALAVLSINFIGDGLRDALDPRVSHR